ncbi:MAG: polysaccharide deacetylase family protein [Candidatus Aenigmatarchaeota archaeon]
MKRSQILVIKLRKIYFTFDVEDFTNEMAFIALQATIELLNKYNFKGIFFITGHFAEKLQKYPKTVELLEEHEIGYHSSSHSVHPTIFEFTDIENYKEAYEISLKRETSHINPLTGEIEGKGGILALQKLFPSKKIESFRAPGHCWTPPHLEALRELGIKFDFSSNLTKVPAYYKGITFYPYPILARWNGKFADFRLFWITAAKNQNIVIGLHPSLFTTYDGWDQIYFNGNPKTMTPSKPRSLSEIRSLIKSFDLFLKNIKILEKIKFLEVESNLKNAENDVPVNRNLVEKCYQHSMRWAKRVFNYQPRFQKKHFYRFFGLTKL